MVILTKPAGEAAPAAAAATEDNGIKKKARSEMTAEEKHADNQASKARKKAGKATKAEAGEGEAAAAPKRSGTPAGGDNKKQKMRPTVGSTVVLLDTDNTRNHLPTGIGQQFTISTDAEDQVPFQVEGSPVWLYEEDVKLVGGPGKPAKAAKPAAVTGVPQPMTVEEKARVEVMKAELDAAKAGVTQKPRSEMTEEEKHADNRIHKLQKRVSAAEKRERGEVPSKAQMQASKGKGGSKKQGGGKGKGGKGWAPMSAEEALIMAAMSGCNPLEAMQMAGMMSAMQSYGGKGKKGKGKSNGGGGGGVKPRADLGDAPERIHKKRSEMTAEEKAADNRARKARAGGGAGKKAEPGVAGAADLTMGAGGLLS